MDPQTLIIWLIVGAIAGWLAGQIMTGCGFGLVGNIVLGIVGAIVAGWLSAAGFWHLMRRRHSIGASFNAADRRRSSFCS